jgi:hypothetical protein
MQFWLEQSPKAAAKIAESLGGKTLAENVQKWTKAVVEDDPNKERFDYIACELEMIQMQLMLVNQKLDEIKQLIITVAVRDAVQHIETNYQSLMLMMITAPNATMAALQESVRVQYDAIVSQNLVFNAANIIHYYLTTSASVGVDPLLLSISKNFRKKSLIEYYVGVKSQAAAYWDSLAKAATLLRFAAEYKEMTIPLYLGQADEIDKMIVAEGVYLEDGTNVVIPNAVRDPAQAWLLNSNGTLAGTFKFVNSNGGPMLSKFDSGTQEVKQIDLNWTAGRGKYYQTGGTQFTFHRFDFQSKTVAWGGQRNAFWSPMGYGDVRTCFNNDCTWKVDHEYTTVGNLQNIVSTVPEVLVTKTFPVLWVIEELTPKNGWKWVCTKKSCDTCTDVIKADRDSYEDVASDNDCQLDIKFAL